MATFLEGSRGSGKSKFAVQKIQRYLNENRRVCTNLDLFLENLCPDNKRANIIRLPDFPRSIDLIACGKAYDSLDHDNPDSYDENKNGLIVIDELLTSFNSRNWNDPDRFEVISWIVQSRKFGWDLYLIGQDFGSVDKQIQDTVVDEIISCRSSEKLFPGMFWKVIVKPWFTKAFGKFHIAKIYDGKSKDDKCLNGVEHFRRDDLHNCYKTGQKFTKDVELIAPPAGSRSTKMLEKDNRALYSVIGTHYFAHEIESQITKPDIKKQFNKSYFYAPILGFLGAFLFSTLFNTSDASSTTAQKPIANNLKTESIEATIKKLTDSDLGQIYIDCLEKWTDGRFTYCFSDNKGSPIHPESVGYQVLYFKDCHAKLRRENDLLNVYCNPRQFNWSDEPPVTEQRKELSI